MGAWVFLQPNPPFYSSAKIFAAPQCGVSAASWISGRIKNFEGAYRVFWLKGGLFFAHEQWRFMVCSASRRAIFFLTLPPLSKNLPTKRNRCRRGGDQEALF